MTAPERQHSIRLRDRRSLAWSEWGPVDGRPVLFCTGAAMSGRMGFGIAELFVLGLRLLAIDRPGLGSSDPHPEKTLASWVVDTEALIAAYQLGAVTAVGFSQGAPFALALARHGLVSAVAIVSGQDELAHPRVAPLLHPDVAKMIEAVQHDPATFERRFSEMADAAGLWRLIMAMSGPKDRALYSSEAFSDAYQRCLKEGFSQGPQGYARDLVNTLGRWPFEVEDITIPVYLWYGGADTSTVHSPDFGATLATRLPNASRTVDPDEGGSILWTRSREILARLTASE